MRMGQMSTVPWAMSQLCSTALQHPASNIEELLVHVCPLGILSGRSVWTNRAIQIA